VGRNIAVQSDYFVDTELGSFGATCAPIESPFPFWYRQKINDGHNHISPDRLVDASTCVLPEQTWFTYNTLHGINGDYSGWWTWFKETDNPTVFSNERYPQFLERTEDGVFVPRVAEPEPFTFMSVLEIIALTLTKIWRSILAVLTGRMLESWC